MKERLYDALKKARADYCEIRYETSDSTHIAYRGPDVEDASSGRYAGGIVRACTRGGWGFAVFDTLDDLDHQVSEACRCAELVGHEETRLAEVQPPVDLDVPARMDHDFRGVGLDEKLALVTAYNQQILSFDPSIANSVVNYTDSFRTVFFASTRGAIFREERPLVRLSHSAVARKGSMTQRSGDSVASKVSYDAVLGQESKIAVNCARAIQLLAAPSCPGGTRTVILDQRLGGVFAHEAFGHLSEADFLYENPKMRDLMQVGREMGVPGLNIVDDGSMGRLIGTFAVDDEGTPTRRTNLIRDGMLAAHLHSLETAAKMSETPSGNARAIGAGRPPIVRMTNTFIEPGTATFDELIKDVDDGVYACGALGGQTMMEMFTFSAEYGYRIRNGKIAEMLRDVVLTGNVFATLKAIDGFAGDLIIFESAGGCGKGGQSPLPVTFGAPHLRIRDVVIAGREQATGSQGS